jgi:hypothetical protein
VILKKHNTIQNYPLSLAHRMVTRYQLVQVLQIKTLNIVPHVRNTFEGTGSLVVRIPLIPDAEDALGLAQDERQFVELGEGLWGGSRRLFLDRILVRWNRSRLAGLRLLSRGERRHSVNSKYLPGDDVLSAQALGEIAE